MVVMVCLNRDFDNSEELFYHRAVVVEGDEGSYLPKW